MSPDEAPRRRVFLVDDHPMVRERLSMLLDQTQDLRVCGEADDVPVALEAIIREKPDIVVADLSLRNSNGLELIKDLKAQGVKVPVLVLSMHDEALYAERVLRAGASGYLSKQENSHEIIRAIRKVLEGKVFLSPEVAASVLRRIVGTSGGNTSNPVEALADRELEVFQLIGSGHSTRRIADMLGLSVKTVESYRARIKEKLALDDGVQLLQRAVLWVESSHLARKRDETD